MHFSRSPFIAFAVRAMIGSDAELRQLTNGSHSLVAIHLRHHDIHQHDVDVGILLKISMPLRPFSAWRTLIL